MSWYTKSPGVSRTVARALDTCSLIGSQVGSGGAFPAAPPLLRSIRFQGVASLLLRNYVKAAFHCSDGRCEKEERILPRPGAGGSEFPFVADHETEPCAFLLKTGCRNMNLLPFRGLLCPPHACACRKTTSLRQNKHNTQDRLTLGQALFPRNLSPRQSSTIPVESLLLPPRSAPCALPAALTGAPLPATHAPSYMLLSY